MSANANTLAHEPILRALSSREGWELDSPMSPTKATFCDDQGLSLCTVSFNAPCTADVVAIRIDPHLELHDKVDLSAVDVSDEGGEAVAVVAISDVGDRLWNDLW